MRWFSWGRSAAAQEKDDPLDDVDYRRKLMVQSRGMGYIDSDMSDLESPFGAPSTPFTGLLNATNDDSVCEEILTLVRDGSGIQELVDSYPEDVISVLKHHSVIKLGTFQATDSEVLKAFGENAMLTRGCQELQDPEWQENWTERIKRRANNKTRYISVGWEEMVSLGAYAVNIKNVAARDRGALLQLLLMKHYSGATTKKIWEFPAVRAVINYHWQHWARQFLVAAAILFLAWLASFTTYIAIYIESDDKSSNSGNGIGADRSLARLVTNVLNILSFIFMCPFALMEYWTIIAQGWRWIQPRNVLDIGAIVLQIFIFTCHMTKWLLHKDWFGIVLASQCVFLFSKLQNFGRCHLDRVTQGEIFLVSRVLGTGASISEIFVSVIYDVRYLLAYIFVTGMSASLSLGAIYKHDEKFQSSSALGNDFSSFKRTLVTTFQIIFGSFDSDYVFKAEYPWIKILFFFGFQVLMTITVLNLLIAVMTESYSKFASEQRIRYNRGRASIIDELEVLRIPAFFVEDLHPYIHFLVVEKKPRTPSASRRDSLAQATSSHPETKEDVLRKRIDELSAKLDKLMSLVARPSNLIRLTHTEGVSGE